MSYESVLQKQDAAVHEQMQDQVMDNTRQDYGGYFSPSAGFAGPSHVGNAAYLMTLGLCYLMPGSRLYEKPEALDRILLAVAFQKHCQRPSGFIDIPQTNFDSPPDTGFVLQQLGALAGIAAASKAAGAKEIETALKPYLISSALAVAGGGFHTPNHRWVVASGLSLVHALYPDAKLQAAIDAYLAEGIDLNADGEYSERSAGGYNAVCNRSLILMAEALDRPELLDFVRRNLHNMLDLMHADWTVVTTLSRRQDRGRRAVPTQVTDSLFYMAQKEGEDRICAGANALLNRGGDRNTWLVYWLARHPEWQNQALKPGQPVDNFARHMPASGVWRVRRDKLSATVATGVEETFSLKYGAVDLAYVRFFAPYFAGANFTATSLDVSGNTAALRLKSDFLLPQLPGYWMPLGRPVAWEDLPHKILDERELKPRPEIEIALTVEEVADGFDLAFRTEGGMPAVPFQAECLFLTPGQIETEQASFPASAGATLLLRNGYLTYHCGSDAITIGPGFHGHRNTFAGDGDGFRVFMTAWTPVDRRLEIRCGRWSEAEGPCPAVGGPVGLSGERTAGPESQ